MLLFEAATKTEKVSDRIIEQIRDAVLSGELKPGDRIASEKELVAQFEVSKATMREALRVLEVMGLVEIRKGTQGGVFVAEVDMKTTVHSIMNFLHFRSVSIRDITMLRFMLEPWVIQIAMLNADETDYDRLTELTLHADRKTVPELVHDIGFHRYLARMTNNPILILIMDFIDNIIRDVKYQLNLGEDFYDQVRDSHTAILAFMRAGDFGGARKEIISDILKVGDYLCTHTGTPRFDPEVLGYEEKIFSYSGGNGDESPKGNGNGSAELLGKILGQQLDPALLTKGLFLRDLGKAQIYMVLPEETSEE
ncbi:MAG: GntR family transcriptional regulator [Deltaproteobacteria bacterium]|nr:GntR family transcriptional regulator [Deltaproteobacteria bacterium]